MKKLLLFLACAPCALIGMQKTVENMSKFVTMEQQQMQDWLNYKKSNCDEMIELMKKHSNQMFNVKKQHFEQVAQGIKHETLMENMLKEMIKLNEAQMKEWKELHDAEYQKGNEIGQRHGAEFAKLKKEVMPEEKETKTGVMPVPAGVKGVKSETLPEPATEMKEVE